MTAAATQQPGLRAFLVYDRSPPDHLPFLVTDDDSAPLLRLGDTVLIDTRQHEPEAGELLLVEYGRHGPHPTRRIVEVSALPLRGGAVAPVGWVLAAYNRPRSRREAEAWIRAGRPLRGIDGPYSATRPEGVAELRDKLIGRVAGILEPAFAEPLRLVGEVRRQPGT